jgi:glycosyltransferase involved in cell wall biosynthesis
VPRLLLLTPAELTRDPRGRRAAVAARDHGYEVVGICGRVAGDEPAALDGVQVVRVGGDAVSSQLRRRGLGGMRRSRPLVRELRGAYRSARLARLTARLASAARPLGRFDVVHANDVDTLPAAWRIASRSGARLVYDSHELYTTQELDPPRGFVAAATRIEGALARRADAVVTTGQPYADELRRRLGLRTAPLIVLNCPPRLEEEPPAPPADGPLRVVYQAAMGPGRPLEDIVEAAKHVHDVQIVLRVVGADEAELQRLIDRAGVADVVEIAKPVPPDRLLEGLRGFHVGLIINRPLTLTDELVVPNKLFEYMMAGLAVVAPRLPGLAAVIDVEGVGSTFEPGRPDRLAAALDELQSARERLDELRGRARRLALERYNAEAQTDVFLEAWDPARA